MLQQANIVICRISPCSRYEIVVPNRSLYLSKLSRLVLIVSIACSCRDRCDSITHLLIQVEAIDLYVSSKFLSNNPSSMSRATSSAFNASSCCLFYLQRQLRLLKQRARNCSSFSCGRTLFLTGLQNSMSIHLEIMLSLSAKSRSSPVITLMLTLLMKLVNSDKSTSPGGRDSFPSRHEAARQTNRSCTSISVYY